MDNKVTKQEVDLVPKGLYPDVNIGTESVTAEDLNTPILKIAQKTTTGAEDLKIGQYILPDGTQSDTVEVNLVFVSTEESENYNKTGVEKKKIYYGFLANTNEPFKMYLRGLAWGAHRNFQTEVLSIKNRYNIPMLALQVSLSTEKQEGTIAETGKPYTTFTPVFTIIRATDGTPLIETDKERVNFLIEAAQRFSKIANQSNNDELQNDIDGDIPEDEKVHPDDIPF